MPLIDLTLPSWAHLPSPRPGSPSHFAQAALWSAPCRGEGRGDLGRGGSWLSRVAFGGRAGSRFSLVPEAAPFGRAFRQLHGDLCARMDPPGPGGKRPGRRRPRRRQQREDRAEAAGP